MSEQEPQPPLTTNAELLAALREIFNEPQKGEPSIARIGRYVAYATVVAGITWHLGVQTGLWRPATQPTEVMNIPAAAALETVAQRSLKVTEHIGNLVAELHSGSAPRDYQQVPLWHGIREEIRRLSEELRRVSDATNRSTRSMYRMVEVMERAEKTPVVFKRREATAQPARTQDDSPWWRFW